MTRAIVFDTPGLLDLRALTLMGTSAKPNSTSPIGRFGTGLKYAVACLVRMGTPPVVWVGRNPYAFEPREDEFRGVPATLIDLVGPFDRRELPYTTGYGASWEPWAVYRELEANTVDEGGLTHVFESDDPGFFGAGNMANPARTRIVVENEAIIAAHEDRDSTFLPGAAREGGPLYRAEPGAAVEVFAPPSRHLYWRGMRVYTLPKPAKRTYNVLDELALTEDRTLRDPWVAAYLVGRHVQTTDDERLALDALYATRDDYEGDLPYSDSLAPSETVTRAYVAQPREDEHAPASSLARRVADFVVRTNPPPPRPDPFARWPRPWYVDGTTLLDDDGSVLIDGLDDTNPRYAERREILELIVAATGAYDPPTKFDEEPPEREPAEPLGDEDAMPF